MRFGVLGPLEITNPEGPVVLRGAKRRGLLAYLLVRTGGVVSVDRLIDELWDGQPSEGATGTVRTYVSQLRKVLAESDGCTLDTCPAGYVLQIPGDALDAVCFERLCAEASVSDDPATRLASLDEALTLWRGAPLGEFAGSAWADVEATRLEALRLQALQQRIDARLALGRHGDVIPELEGLIDEHPLDEHFWAQLMVAYYRAGRQSDALRTYQRLRATLAEELGIEPGSEVADLERKILDHDPTLALPDPVGYPATARPGTADPDDGASDHRPAAGEEPPHRHRAKRIDGPRAFVVIAAVLGIALAVAAAWIFFTERDGSEPAASTKTEAPASSVPSETPPDVPTGPSPTGVPVTIPAPDAAGTLIPEMTGYSLEDFDLDTLRTIIAADLADRRGFDLLAAKVVEGASEPVMVYVIGPETGPGAAWPFGVPCGNLDTITLEDQTVCDQFLAPTWVFSWGAGDYIIRVAAYERDPAIEVMEALIIANVG